MPGNYAWLRTPEVVDNLDSDKSTAALSAKQGKVLKELIGTGTGGGSGTDTYYRGAYNTSAELIAAHPTDTAGAYATVINTGTMWIWDTATNGWKDTTRPTVGSKGPVGDKGPTGDKGPIGDKGPKGDPGSGSSVNIVDNLTSDDSSAALSAKQGKVLKELVDSNSTIDIVDDLVTDDSTKALSAKQGKVLKDSIPELEAGTNINITKDNNKYTIASLLSSGAGVTVVDVPKDKNFATSNMKIEIVAPNILIPGLGMYKYDAASTSIVDGETVVAVKDGTPGRYLLVLPDLDWLFALCVEQIDTHRYNLGVLIDKANERIDKVNEEYGAKLNKIITSHRTTVLTATQELDFGIVFQNTIKELTIDLPGAKVNDPVLLSHKNEAINTYSVLYSYYNEYAYVKEDNKVTVCVYRVNAGGNIALPKMKYTVQIVKELIDE